MTLSDSWETPPSIPIYRRSSVILFISVVVVVFNGVEPLMHRLDVIYNIRGLFKKYREFCIFSKSIYFFMNIYFIPFKVIPIRNYTLVPTFFPILEVLQKIIFCDLGQLLLRCRVYLLNHGVALFFNGPLQFWKQEKVTGGQVWVIRWLRHH